MKTPRGLSHLLFVLMVTTVCAAFLRADIRWENTSVELSAAPGDQQVVAEYKFRVTGDAPLRIEKVDTGCGCASEELDKREFAPGEAGSLKIRFEVGDREGVFRTPMLVRWKQGQVQREDTLILEVRAPVVLTFSRRVLVFAKPMEVQTLQVTANPDLGLTLSLGAIVGGYDAKLKAGPGGEHTLLVTAGKELYNGFVEIVAKRDRKVVKTARVFLRLQQ